MHTLNILCKEDIGAKQIEAARHFSILHCVSQQNPVTPQRGSLLDRLTACYVICPCVLAVQAML